jgi:hypothetical protein
MSRSRLIVPVLGLAAIVFSTRLPAVSLGAAPSMELTGTVKDAAG